MYLYILIASSAHHILSFLAKAPMLLISDSKLGSRTSAGLGERPSAAPSLCSLPTDLAESRLSLLCICNLKASDGPLRVPPVSCVQLNIGSNKAWANCKCQGRVGMCIQMQKKSKKKSKGTQIGAEIYAFQSFHLQLSSMDHQVDPSEHFRKTTGISIQTSNLLIS